MQHFIASMLCCCSAPIRLTTMLFGTLLMSLWFRILAAKTTYSSWGQYCLFFFFPSDHGQNVGTQNNFRKSSFFFLTFRPDSFQSTGLEGIYQATKSGPISIDGNHALQEIMFQPSSQKHSLFIWFFFLQCFSPCFICRPDLGSPLSCRLLTDGKNRSSQFEANIAVCGC